MTKTAVLCILALTLLGAGCVEPSSSGDDASQPSALVAPPYGTKYGCPSGPDDCVRDFSSTTEGFSEPFLATHPSNPETFAIGVHVRPKTFVGDMQEPTGLGMALMLTRDGGQSFQRHDVPFPPPRLEGPSIQILSDPTLAFDPQGNIDLVGIAIERRADLLPFTRDVAPIVEGNFAQVFHARFINDSFTVPTWIVPESRNQDRPWLLRHPGSDTVYVTWQTEGQGTSTTTFAWLSEGEWHVLDPAKELQCHSTGPLVPADDGVLVSCSDYTKAEIQVWSFQAGGDPVLSSVVSMPADENTRSFLAVGARRTYLIIEPFSGDTDRGFASAIAYWKDDGEWMGPLNLATTLEHDPAFVTWAIADQKDRLHLLVRTASAMDGRNSYRLEHAVLAPPDTPWHRTLDHWEDAPTRSILTNTPDHDFESLALRPDGGVLLAWGRVTDGRQSADGIVRLTEAR